MAGPDSYCGNAMRLMDGRGLVTAFEFCSPLNRQSGNSLDEKSAADVGCHAAARAYDGGTRRECLTP